MGEDGGGEAGEKQYYKTQEILPGDPEYSKCEASSHEAVNLGPRDVCVRGACRLKSEKCLFLQGEAYYTNDCVEIYAHVKVSVTQRSCS